MLKFFLVFFFIFYHSVVNGQHAKKWEKKYERAVKELKKGKTESAESKFYEIIDQQPPDSILASVMYYHALCNVRLQRWNPAALTLNQLQKRFPAWEGIDESFYLQELIALELSELNIAVGYLDKINQADLKQKGEEMLAHYLEKYPLEKLKEIQSVYPEKRIIAQVLVDQIAYEGEEYRDLRLMNHLIQKMDLKKPKKVKVEYVDHPVKDTLHVGILFPFDISNLDKLTNRSRATQISVNFYHGLKMAKEVLDSLGVKVRLVVLDVSNDLNKFSQIDERKLKYIDFFIGPIYADLYEAALEKFHDKVIINPVLSDEKWLNSHNAYMINPTEATIGKKLMEYVFNKNKSACILYAKDQSVSGNAVMYESMREYNRQHDKKGEFIGINGDREDFNTLIKKLTEKTPHPDYIIVTSRDKNFARLALRNLHRFPQKSKIIAPKNWTAIEGFSSRGLEGKLSFWNEHMSIDNDSTFIKKYNINALNLKRKNQFEKPDIYTYQGYDVLMKFVQMSDKLDQDIRKKLPLKNYTNLYFSNQRDGQYLPIFTFKDEKEVMLNYE